jgi:type II secretory pathway component GspD/PulD (secretin)
MLSRTTALLAAGLFAVAASAQQLPKPVPCPLPTAPAVATQPRMVQATYQVAELVVPVGNTAADPGKKGEPAKPVATQEAALIKMIQETVAPKSWASNGGRGTIDYFPRTMTLIVSQAPDVQEQVADMLAALRRLQDTEVALEVRLVTVPDQFFERVGVDFNAPACQNGGPCPVQAATRADADRTAFLGDKQLVRFLEAVQGDPRSNVMQAPKMTLLDGQMGRLEAVDRQHFVTGCEIVQREGHALVIPKNEEVALGFRIAACPKVSADRRSVQVKLDVSQTNLASAAVPLFPVTMQLKDNEGKPQPFTQFLQQPVVNTFHLENTVTIPDGGTVLVGGMKKEVEARCEYGPPVLSRVPYANRLFKNVGVSRESKTVYVLVTPRVIVNTEEEQRPPTCPAKGSPCCRTAPMAVVEECQAAVPVPDGQGKVIAELLRAYDQACAAGHKDEAAKLAQAALILDSTCFAKSRGK